jgi:hypothetical protein
MFSIVPRFTGIQPNSGVHPNNGGMGNGAYAFRPQRPYELGAYTAGLPCMGDVDSNFRMFAAGYYPWYIHSDVAVVAFQSRMTPGGLWANPGTREDREEAAYKIFCERYGDKYFILTKKRTLKIQWKKYYLDHTDFDYDTLRPTRRHLESNKVIRRRQGVE